MDEENNLNNNGTKMPMAWWKFWKYFRFPASIVVLVFSLIVKYTKVDFNLIGWLGWTPLIIDILALILCLVTYIMMLVKYKRSYNFFILNLFVESVRMIFMRVLMKIDYDSIINNSLSLDYNYIAISGLKYLVFIGAIWILPNYVYFKNRKAYFTCKEEK